MVYTFIVNPLAGGIFKKERTKLIELLRQSTLTYDVLETEYPRHAVELARAASGRSDVVVAVGGDGTVNEVVSGIVQSDRAAHLGVIPTGSGNDFAKMLDLPRDLKGLLAGLRRGRPTPIDYGRVDWKGADAAGSAVFINAAGTGIDANVAAAASRIKILSGTGRYLVAVLRTLRTWKAPHMDITLYRDGEEFPGGTSRHLFVLAGNGKCAAGGFYLTPDARIDDGKLDACIVRNASLPRILALIPLVLRGGRHIHEPEVTLEKIDKIRIRSSTRMPIQVDGEVIMTGAHVVTIQVEAGRLSLVQPVKR